MNSREQVIRAFLQGCGWQQARRQAMTADASFRSYERLRGPDGDTAILMNAPPETNESVGIFADIANILLGYGYSAPQILVADPGNGLLLLEDLGDDLFAQLCLRQPELQGPLYAAAVDLLIDLSRQSPPAGLPPYSDAFYRSEAALLPQWYLQALPDRPDQAQTARFTDLVSQACAAAAPFTGPK